MNVRQAAEALVERHRQGLFAATFPVDVAAHRAAERDLKALAADLASRPEGDPLLAALENSGIAGSGLGSTFSWEATRWLCDRFPDAVRLLYLDADPADARALLERALDPMERDGMADRDLPWEDWQRRFLGADEATRLPRLVALAARLSDDVRAREDAWSRLKVFVRWRLPADAPNLTAARLRHGAIHTHGTGGFIRVVTPAERWKAPAPEPVALSAADRRALADAGRGVMLSLLRETDFFTYVDEARIEAHDMGRGICIVLYPCRADRQLTLDSYVGYLLFKNRVPVAYGGSWIMGPQAAFGVNVLPPYRGGESALIVSELLRLYGTRFALQVMRVEASQIAASNADGIHSGAFWFYRRLGFEPLQPALRVLAEKDWARILEASDGRPAARHYDARVLRRLGDAVLVWPTPLDAGWRFVDPAVVGERVTSFIEQRFGGDRSAAARAAQRHWDEALWRRAPGLRALAVTIEALAPQDGWTAAQRKALGVLLARKHAGEPAFAARASRNRTWCAMLQRALGAPQPSPSAGAGPSPGSARRLSRRASAAA